MQGQKRQASSIRLKCNERNLGWRFEGPEKADDYFISIDVLLHQTALLIENTRFLLNLKTA